MIPDHIRIAIALRRTYTAPLSFEHGFRMATLDAEITTWELSSYALD